MKKSSYETIYATLSAINFDNAEIMEELDREIHRNDEAKAKKAQSYEALHDVIVGALDETPITCGELYESIEDKLPSGATRGKVQYALTHLWKDEIVTIVGKPNTYHKA